MTANDVIYAMIEYFGDDRRRINHLMKVYTFADTIAEKEKVSKELRTIIRVAAAVHDIGIKISEEKYNSSSGKYQEIEGPAEAKKLLSSLGCDEKIIERVCYLVAHHHTYDNIDAVDYQILVEADFLVNLDEECAGKDAAVKVREKIFRTKTAKKLLDVMFDL